MLFISLSAFVGWFSSFFSWRNAESSRCFPPICWLLCIFQFAPYWSRFSFVYLLFSPSTAKCFDRTFSLPPTTTACFVLFFRIGYYHPFVIVVLLRLKQLGGVANVGCLTARSSSLRNPRTYFVKKASLVLLTWFVWTKNIIHIWKVFYVSWTNLCFPRRHQTERGMISRMRELTSCTAPLPLSSNGGVVFAFCFT